MIYIVVLLHFLNSCLLATNSKYERAKEEAEFFKLPEESKDNSALQQDLLKGYSQEKAEQILAGIPPEKLEEKAKELLNSENINAGGINHILNAGEENRPKINVKEHYMQQSNKISAAPLDHLKGEATIRIKEGYGEYEDFECESVGDTVEFNVVERRNFFPKIGSNQGGYTATRISGRAYRGREKSKWWGPRNCKHGDTYEYFSSDTKLKEQELKHFEDHEYYYHVVDKAYDIVHDINLKYTGCSTCPAPFHQYDLINDTRDRIDARHSSLVRENPLPANLRSKIRKTEIKFGGKLENGELVIENNSMVQIHKIHRLSNRRGGQGDGKDWNIIFRVYLKAALEEYITGINPELERLSEQGICEKIEMEVIEGKGEKDFYGTKVSRDWWKRRTKYLCNFRIDKEKRCGKYLARGCSEIGKPVCLRKVQNICILYKRRYRCLKHYRDGEVNIGGDIPFCLDGSCSDKDYALDENFADAMTRLQMLNELGKEFADLTDAEKLRNNIKICRGDNLNCDVQTGLGANFRNCCRTDPGGWGKAIGAKCSEEERLLVGFRNQNRCVRIGTYVVERLMFGIKRNRTSFCCFSSRFLRIMQEEGRKQLGLGWGTPQEPNCAGFTPAQLAKIDFSKIDFSEVFEDLKPASVDPTKLARGFVPTLGLKLQKEQKTCQESLPSQKEISKRVLQWKKGNK